MAKSKEPPAKPNVYVELDEYIPPVDYRFIVWPVLALTAIVVLSILIFTHKHPMPKPAPKSPPCDCRHGP